MVLFLLGNPQSRSRFTSSLVLSILAAAGFSLLGAPEQEGAPPSNPPQLRSKPIPHTSLSHKHAIKFICKCGPRLLPPLALALPFPQTSTHLLCVNASGDSKPSRLYAAYPDERYSPGAGVAGAGLIPNPYPGVGSLPTGSTTPAYPPPPGGGGWKD